MSKSTNRQKSLNDDNKTIIKNDDNNYNSPLKNRYMAKRLCRAAKEFIENMTN